MLSHWNQVVMESWMVNCVRCNRVGNRERRSRALESTVIESVIKRWRAELLEVALKIACVGGLRKNGQFLIFSTSFPTAPKPIHFY